MLSVENTGDETIFIVWSVSSCFHSLQSLTSSLLVGKLVTQEIVCIYLIC